MRRKRRQWERKENEGIVRCKKVNEKRDQREVEEMRQERDRSDHVNARHIKNSHSNIFNVSLNFTDYASIICWCYVMV